MLSSRTNSWYLSDSRGRGSIRGRLAADGIEGHGARRYPSRPSRASIYEPSSRRPSGGLLATMAGNELDVVSQASGGLVRLYLPGSTLSAGGAGSVGREDLLWGSISGAFTATGAAFAYVMGIVAAWGRGLWLGTAAAFVLASCARLEVLPYDSRDFVAVAASIAGLFVLASVAIRQGDRDAVRTAGRCPRAKHPALRRERYRRGRRERPDPSAAEMREVAATDTRT